MVRISTSINMICKEHVLEFLTYPFMQRAMLVGGISGLVCSVLGVFVLYRRLSFISAGISHAAFAGVALALLLATPIIGTTLFVCAVTAILIGYMSELGKINEDTSTGVAYSAMMAVGVVLFGMLPGTNVDLFGYLFGNILASSQSDMWLSALLGIGILILVKSFYKELILISFDEELAFVTGVPSRALNYLLLVIMSVAIVVAIKSVGIILVSALLVTPAAIATQISNNFHRIVLISALIGVLGTELGLIFAYFANTPPGASIVLLLTAIFLSSIFIKGYLQSHR